MNHVNENAALLYAIAQERQSGLPENNSRDALVSNVLRRFGLSAKLDGYWYIRTAVLLAMENPYMLHLMTKTLYPTVARVYNTKASCVDRSIRHALDRCWICADTDTIEAFFGYALRSGRRRPSGGEFISVITDGMCLMEKGHSRKRIV